ncbi:hypothetical protein [Microbacterium gorillae]|uniref:hypothetical protein n=1 Tax=Microbacterium gorillae TaxID=1231063 RepID=UPI003D9849AB
MVFNNPEESLARIQEDVARAEARAKALPLMQEQIAQVRGRAQSRQRDISVEVDASGQVSGLDISDDALSRGGRAVSREVLDLIKTATIRVREQSLAITTELLGADDPIVKLTADQLAADIESTDQSGDLRW